MSTEARRGVSVGEVPPQSEDLHLICVRINKMNPIFIAAQILAQSQRDLTVRFSTEVMGQEVEGMVVIYMDDKVSKILGEFHETPEAKALDCAVFPPDFPDRRPDLSVCQWNNKTKKRVEALYWQNRAAFYQQWADSSGVDRYEDLAKEMQTRARKLLGKLTPLTPEDVRFLFVPVVDRVCHLVVEQTVGSSKPI